MAESKEGALKTDLHSYRCATVHRKYEAVMIDLWICYQNVVLFSLLQHTTVQKLSGVQTASEYPTRT